MDLDGQITQHYQHGTLLKSIEAGLDELGKSSKNVTIEDLAPVDEFHVGGRLASKHFLDQLKLAPGIRVLDVGCGLGGAARYAAKNYQANVTGVDLTPEYIETGQTLCKWVSLSKQVTLQEDNALAMTFESERFDCAYMMHVGMNIENKRRLFSEVNRVLSPGALFGVYDLMQSRPGDLSYPVPWATSPTTSWLANPKNYKLQLQNAGFTILSEEDRRDFALDFFEGVQKTNKLNGGPPPLGLHTLMQHSTSEKITNMIKNITTNLIAPYEIIARKA